MRTFVNTRLFLLALLLPACGQQLVEFPVDGGAGDTARDAVADVNRDVATDATADAISDAVPADRPETGVTDAGENVAPTVIATTPIRAATGVPTNSSVIAMFSEPMNAATLNATTFTVVRGTTAVAGTVSYLGTTATFAPMATLAAGAVYTATITTGARDVAGNGLAVAYTWNFTTGLAPDITAPRVVATIPLSGATGRPTNGAVVATFSEAMAPATLNTTTFTLKQGTTTVPGAVTYLGTSATFTPAMALSPSTVFTASIGVGATDLAGNALGAPYTWSFTTGLAADTTAPTVIATIPASNATGAPVNGTIVATFSEAMAPATLNTTSFTVMRGATPVTGTVTYLGATATFTPDAALAPSASFVGSISTAATDVAGNALAAAYTWTFVTGMTPDATAPFVVATIPLDGAAGTAVNGAAIAVFNEGMDPASLNATTFIVQQGTTMVAGTVTYLGITATFLPTATLAPSTVFTATITTGAKDVAGNALASAHTWSFTTGLTPDTTAPTALSTAPGSNSTGSSVNGTVVVTFDEPLNPATVNPTTFTVHDGTTVVAGTVTYLGPTATFTPTAPLLPGTVYTATITTGAEDVAGNALTAPITWTFTTGVIPDASAPVVIGTLPTSNATGVPVNAPLVAIFSEAMAPATINAMTFTLLQGTTAVPGTVTYLGATATFTPTTALAASTPFTASITTGAKDLAGNALAAAYTWTFTTGLAADTAAPTVVTTVPANNGTGAPINGTVVVTFSEPMNPATLNTTSFTVKQGATLVAGTVTYLGSVATFTPASNLAPSTLYTASITTGAKDVAGNALAAAYTWTFTTGLVPDTTPPTVLSTTPANLTTNVSVRTKLTATFSEAMDPATLTLLTFTLRRGLILVPGLVTYDVLTAKATLSPTSDLLPNTIYEATITTGAKDVAGNALVTAVTWTFTTSACSQSTVVLGAAGNFVVLAGSTVTSTGPTSVTGNLGVSPGTAVTGFPPGILIGAMHTGNPTSALGIFDLTTAYNDAAGRTLCPVSKAGNLGGQTLPPGLYKSTSSLEVSSGDLTLDAQGDGDAVFIFQMASTLTATAGRQVLLIGGAKAINVFWQVGTSATLGTTSVFHGTIMADQAITMGTGATLNGRVLARIAAVSLDSNIIVPPAP